MNPLAWLLDKLGDWAVDRMAEDRERNGLDDLDPRDLTGSYSSRETNGSIVYTENYSQDSWYVDVGGDGTIDAHVVRDSIGGNYWADVGNGYVNYGPNPDGMF